MIAPGRQLYRFDADESPWTYNTNYLITIICVLGVALYIVKPPAPQAPPRNAEFGRFAPATLLAVHLGLYGLVMVIGGLGHHVWIYNQCPGLEMPANVTVPCPVGLNNEPVISAYLLFLGPAIFQLVPLCISLCRGARGGTCGYTLQVYVCQALGLATGIFGCAMGHDGFIYLGVLLVLSFVLLPICAAVGLCIEPGCLVTGKALVIVASIIGIIGFAVQQGFAPMCGAAAYRVDGVSNCPFGGNGISGINHNAVFHLIDAVSKLVLVLALRFLRVASAQDDWPKDPQHGAAQA